MKMRQPDVYYVDTAFRVPSKYVDDNLSYVENKKTLVSSGDGIELQKQFQTAPVTWIPNRLFRMLKILILMYNKGSV